MSSGSTKRREIRRDLLIVGIIWFSRLLPRLLVNISRRYFPTFRLNPDESCEFLVKFSRLLVFRLLVTFPDDVSRLIVPVSRLPTFCVHRYSIKYLGLNLLSFCYTGWFLINCFFLLYQLRNFTLLSSVFDFQLLFLGIQSVDPCLKRVQYRLAIIPASSKAIKLSLKMK